VSSPEKPGRDTDSEQEDSACEQFPRVGDRRDFGRIVPNPVAMTGENAKRADDETETQKTSKSKEARAQIRLGIGW